MILARFFKCLSKILTRPFNDLARSQELFKILHGKILTRSFSGLNLARAFLTSSLENLKQKLAGAWMILQESLIWMILHGMIANIQAGEVREV